MMDHFNSIFGQTTAKKFLANVINSKNIPHAFLFSGRDGIGKEFAAVQFAKLINQSSGDLEKVSSSILNLSEPYIKYVFPLPRGKNETDKDGAYDKLSNDVIDEIKELIKAKINNPYSSIKLSNANNIKISSIRDIKKFIVLDYSDIPYRIILIAHAHLMSTEAQNALLKQLEEPPAGIIFILCTSLPSQLSATIRSRCWEVNFSPLKEEDISEILITKFDVDKKLAKNVSIFSNGSITEALDLIENNFNEMFNDTIQILRFSFAKKYNSAYNIIEKYSSINNSNLKLILKLLIIWFNDLNKEKNDLTNIYFKEHLGTLEKFNSKFSSKNVVSIVEKLDEFSLLINRNINPTIITMNIVNELAAFIR